jgi:Uma2 family endonuclease
MSALPEKIWSPETYLAYERDSSERHEYLAGEIYAMAGASANHNLIVANAISSFHAQLRQKPCRVYPSDMRLKVKQSGLYTYPDISIVCGEPQFEDADSDTLLNPTVIIEVLSPTTEAYDRGKKFQHYRTLVSLQEYVLIAQDSYQVEHYSRQADDTWLLSDVNSLTSTLTLPSIQCTVLITDLYEKVSFKPSADQ